MVMKIAFNKDVGIASDLTKLNDSDKSTTKSTLQTPARAKVSCLFIFL
jgi:hypothetical protein